MCVHKCVSGWYVNMTPKHHSKEASYEDRGTFRLTETLPRQESGGVKSDKSCVSIGVAIPTVTYIGVATHTPDEV